MCRGRAKRSRVDQHLAARPRHIESLSSFIEKLPFRECKPTLFPENPNYPAQSVEKQRQTCDAHVCLCFGESGAMGENVQIWLTRRLPTCARRRRTLLQLQTCVLKHCQKENVHRFCTSAPSRQKDRRLRKYISSLTPGASAQGNTTKFT